MLRSQHEPFEQRHTIDIHSKRRHPLLQRHPVLLPLTLISSSILLSIASFFPIAAFPFSLLVGTPSTLVFLLLAFVLGICGILTSIIGIIESVERYAIQAALFPQLEEPGYDRN